MKSIIYLVFLEALFLLIPPDAHAAGTVDDYRFFSKALNREMTCRVYLPEVYEPNNPEKRFPVVYFLHGASLGYDSYDLIYAILDNLIAFKLIKPVILVLPDGLAPPYNGSYYTNSALYGNYEDYISYDLISFIDSAFHTKNERSKRAIMGASMGGYGALKLAFKHQDLFIGVAGHSGPVNINMMDIFIPDLIAEDGGTAPFHWSPGPGKSLTNLTFSMAGAFSPNLNNLYQVDFPLDSLAKPIPEVMERWKTENVCEIARIYHPGSNLGINFDCGIADEYHLYYQNRSLADTLTKYNIPFKYEEYAGTHTSGLPVRVSLSFVYFDLLFQADDASVPLLQTGSKWNVFPNPASNTLTVCNNHTGPSLNKQNIQIADATGRVVLNQILIDGMNNINITDLPEGLYFFKIQCDNIIQTGKTMIVR
ncbi:MAG: alpha/beta hydrolase-fold protein [Bacteroidales bacterium]